MSTTANSLCTIAETISDQDHLFLIALSIFKTKNFACPPLCNKVLSKSLILRRFKASPDF